MAVIRAKAAVPAESCADQDPAAAARLASHSCFVYSVQSNRPVRAGQTPVAQLRVPMPQAKVFGIREHLVPIRQAVSDAINESIASAFKFPAERRLQRFFPMDPDDFIYPSSERSVRYLIVE